MTKQTELDKIKNLFKSPTVDVCLCHFKGKYTLIQNNQSEGISLQDACKLIQDNTDIELIHFSTMPREWNRVTQEFEGPQDSVPQIFEGRTVNIIDVDSPEPVAEYINLKASGKPGSVNTRMPVHSVAPGTTILFPPGV